MYAARQHIMVQILTLSIQAMQLQQWSSAAAVAAADLCRKELLLEHAPYHLVCAGVVRGSWAIIPFQVRTLHQRHPARQHID
jgi:hypothetical protein